MLSISNRGTHIDRLVTCSQQIHTLLSRYTIPDDFKSFHRLITLLESPKHDRLAYRITLELASKSERLIEPYLSVKNGTFDSRFESPEGNLTVEVTKKINLDLEGLVRSNPLICLILRDFCELMKSNKNADIGHDILTTMNRGLDMFSNLIGEAQMLDALITDELFTPCTVTAHTPAESSGPRIEEIQ